VLLATASVTCDAVGARAGTATAVGAGGYLAVRALLDELRDERVRTGRHTEAQLMAVLVAIIVGAWALVSLGR
jgi:hypothetical protein